MSIILISIIIITTFLGLIYKLFYDNTKEVIIEETIYNTKQTVSYISLIIENIEHGIDIYINDISNQEKLYDIITYNGSYNYDYYNTISEIISSLGNVNNTMKGALEVQVYLDNPKILIGSNEGLKMNLSSIVYEKSNAIMKEMHLNKWFDSKELDGLIEPEWGRCIAYIKPIYSTIDGTKLGFIMVAYSKNIMDNILKSSSFSKKIILDNEYNIIIELDNEQQFMTSEDIQNGIQRLDYNEVIQIDNYISVVEKIPYTDWVIVTFTSAKLENEKKLQMFQYGIIIIIAIIMTLFIIMKILSINLFNRLVVLTSAMEQFQVGDFDVQINDSKQDDLSYIYDSFNGMVKEIKNLIAELYDQKLLKQEAELQLLHSQINPHFIYNIFDNMNWLLQLERFEDLEVLIDSVSSYYKSMLTNGENLIQIEDVIKQVSSYLDIQKIRFSSKLDYLINIEETVYNNYIINYMLLPLVENAVNHGVEPAMNACFVEIKAFSDGEKLHFSVKDNGIGMSKEKINELKIVFNNSSVITNNHYYGLANIYKRLTNFYNGDFGFEIISEGVGVEVKIIVPIMTK